MTPLLYSHRLASREDVRVASRTVVDNPAYAWRNLDEKAQKRFYSQLDADFVHDNRPALDAAATVLFGPLLIAVWTEHGYQALFGPDGLPMQRRPKNFPWYEVWDEAACRLDPYAVVIKARLDDELLRYAAAHTRVEHLDRAVKGLRPHTEQLRTELHDRLDAIDATFTDDTCEKARQQLDGQRAGVDTAWTRAQLEHLATEIPA
jgi:hypothetical protein